MPTEKPNESAVDLLLAPVDPEIWRLLKSSQTGKKETEREQLHRFLSAYAEVTGERLKVIAESESPDFICQRDSGDVVGVELTRPKDDVSRDLMEWDQINAPEQTRTDDDLLSDISAIIEIKSLKLKNPDWRHPHATILVVQLFDFPFRSLDWLSDNDFSGSGFAEIWIADHTTVDAYGCVRLIGLHPAKYAGAYDQRALHGKPYG